MQFVRVDALKVFQFPPLREGRLSGAAGDLFVTLFQFPPLREGRRARRFHQNHGAYFNSHPCARGDSLEVMAQDVEFLFQFPPLREGRRGAYYHALILNCYFNSHPCARGDAVFCPVTPLTLLFQFPPLREGRPVTRTTTNSLLNFNSHPCARGDCP